MAEGGASLHHLPFPRAYWKSRDFANQYMTLFSHQLFHQNIRIESLEGPQRVRAIHIVPVHPAKFRLAPELQGAEFQSEGQSVPNNKFKRLQKGPKSGQDTAPLPAPPPHPKNALGLLAPMYLALQATSFIHSKPPKFPYPHIGSNI